MAARYHPLYSDIWNEEKLDGCSLEQIGFTIYLFSNPRVRPSGIYRVSNAQAAVDTRLSEHKAAAYLTDLHRRRFIVRDGDWIFVCGYLRRQPKGERLMLGVEADVDHCSSAQILESFSLQYPILSRWSRDRLVKVTRPCNGNVPTEQLQSRAVTEQLQSSTEQSKGPSPSGLLARQSPPGFDAFWQAYPKKVGRDAALKAWGQKHCESESGAVMAGLERQQSYLARDQGKYIPNPSTWLNQGRWKDEPPERNGHQAGFGTMDMSGIQAFLEAHKHD